VSINTGKKPAILFAQAMRVYRQGQLPEAIQLFEEVITVCEQENISKENLARIAAHISLYKIHRMLGHDDEATAHFRHAINLGASEQRLRDFETLEEN